VSVVRLEYRIGSSRPPRSPATGRFGAAVDRGGGRSCRRRPARHGATNHCMTGRGKCGFGCVFWNGCIGTHAVYYCCNIFYARHSFGFKVNREKQTVDRINNRPICYKWLGVIVITILVFTPGNSINSFIIQYMSSTASLVFIFFFPQYYHLGIVSRY